MIVVEILFLWQEILITISEPGYRMYCPIDVMRLIMIENLCVTDNPIRVLGLKFQLFLVLLLQFVQNIKL